MADGYRFPQQSAGNYYYPQQQHHQHPQPHHPRHQITRNTTPPNSIRPGFNADTPSPSRSPNSNSPAQPIYGMFNQAHQGQHGRVNGGLGGRGTIPMMYNFQHQNSHQQQHQQHHSNIQQDHNAHNSNGINHQPSFSSGVLSNSTPCFTPGNLQNGQITTTRGGQAQQITEHWAEQLKAHKEAEKINLNMTELGQPNHFARTRASENRGIQSVQPPQDADSDNAEVEKDPTRMAETVVAKRRHDWINLDICGQGLRVLSDALFNYEFLVELYLSSNKLTYIPPSIGNLRNLRQLDVSNNQLSELPPELGLCTLLERILVFDNNLKTLPYELGYLHNLEMLGIEGNKEMDPEVRQMIMEKGTVALITHLRENAPVPLPPAPRAILDLQEGTPSAGQERFRVFSMNILANNSCTTRAYGYSPAETLSWDYRKEKILQEIEAQDADIVCLQEIEKDAFEEFFSMKLAYFGYKGVFWSRSRAKTMSDKDKKTVDGCATFYKGSKYILLDKQGVEFGNSAINRPDMKAQSDIFNRVMPRDHIGLLTFLENRETGSRLVVAGTHIFWDPKYADIKLIQVALLMAAISKAVDKWSKWPACTDKKTYSLADSDGDTIEVPREYAPSKEYTKTQLPLVICADLNSTYESGVYELLAKGSVRPDHPEIRGFKYGDFTTHGIDHPFQLRSAYTNLDKSPDAIRFTNYTATFRGIIDHIWYSTNALENVALLGGIDPEYMRKVPGFPNHHFPSDHMSLMAEFVVKGVKEKKQRTEPDFGPSSRRDRRND